MAWARSVSDEAETSTRHDSTFRYQCQSKLIPPVARDGSFLHYGCVETIGDRLKFALEEAGMGMNAADRAVDQGAGYTSRLASNKKKRPDPAILQRYADALGVRLEWLTTGRLPMRQETEGGSESHYDRGTRLFLELFLDERRLVAEEFVREKQSEAARLPSAWDAARVMRYWMDGFDTWVALRKGKAVMAESEVEEMDENEATPAFARRR